jgi:hypothetical protein
MKTLFFVKSVIILLVAILVSSCNKENADVGIKFTSTYATAKSTTTKAALAEGVVIESFRINVQEIEIEFNDDDPLFETDSVASDYELDGPFEINLMEEGNTLETMLVSNIELPYAAYDEIEFEFEESENSISDMFGKSMLVEGTIHGTPFVFWTDEEIEVEIEFEETVYLDEASQAVLIVSFDIASLFNPLTGVDISNAAVTTDEDGNGKIHIHPGAPDGNSDLADDLWEKIETIIEAFEDMYDD